MIRPIPAATPCTSISAKRSSGRSTRPKPCPTMSGSSRTPASGSRNSRQKSTRNLPEASMRTRRLSVVTALALFASGGLVHAQVARDLSSDQIVTACAPSPAVAPTPLNALRVRGAQDTSLRRLFGAGDLVIVNGGTEAGAAPGQRYFLGRTGAFGYGGAAPAPNPRARGTHSRRPDRRARP